MSEAIQQSSNSIEGKHLILYDGVCGLCNRFVQFVLRRDMAAVFYFASLQSTTGKSVLQRLGATPDSMDTIYVVKDYRSAMPTFLSKAKAALFVMETLKSAYWLRLLRFLPWSWLDFGYDFVARHRYKVFGRTETCMMPNPEFAKRFIDV